MSEKVIYFGDHRNKKTGYLSNVYMKPFKLEDKLWWSVEHYMQAKKFSSNEYEELIRKAPTVYLAKLLASDEVSSKKGFSMRSGYSKMVNNLLETSIRAKFSTPHLKEKLLDTGDASLKCKNHPELGTILENVRKSFSPEEEMKNNKIRIDAKDISPPTKKTKQFVMALIYMIKKIARYECCKNLHPEMTEDALYTLFPMLDVPYLTQIRVISKIPWTYIYHNLPNYKALYEYVNKCINSYDISISISAAYKWYSSSPENIKEYIHSQLKNVKTLDVLFLKKKRYYRNYKVYKYSK